jgi:hypothetical protein
MFKSDLDHFNFNPNAEAWTESLRLPAVTQQELELWGNLQLATLLARWKHFESADSRLRDLQDQKGRVLGMGSELDD